MKILRNIVVVILSIVGLLLITGLFVTNDYAVVREVTINKPKAEVFNYVKFLKSQDDFSVWNKRDPEMKRDFSGVDGTVGATAFWDSQNKEVGKGEQEIKAIVEGEKIEFELRFKIPFEATDKAYFSTEALAENETKVQWGFNGSMAYPMNLMLLLMNMDEMLGPDLETGLNNLKAHMESMPAAPAVVEEMPMDTTAAAPAATM